MMFLLKLFTHNRTYMGLTDTDYLFFDTVRLLFIHGLTILHMLFDITIIDTMEVLLLSDGVTIVE